MRINVLYSYYPVLYDWATTTSYCLRKLGIESDVYCPKIKGESRDLTDGWCGNNPKFCYKYPDADYYILLNDAEFTLENIPDCAKRIVWSTEPIEFGHDNIEIQYKTEQLLRLRHWADFMIVQSRIHKKILEDRHIRIDDVMAIGYDECLTHFADKCNKEIDIYFEGGFNERRKNILSNFEPPIHSDGVYMHAYHKNMAMSKIALNIHSYDCFSNFEVERIMTAIAEKALVVSEEIADIHPYTAGEHLVLCSKKEIPDVCRYYLEHENERNAIVENAFEYVKNNYRLEDLLYNFIVNNIDSSFEKNIVEAEVPKVIL